MKRRTLCSLLLSGASAAALAACADGSTLVSEEPQTAKTTEKEAAPEPTAAPAKAEAKVAATAEPTAAPTAAPALDLPNLGKAPEITLTEWLNSDPITLASLEGKASALIVFWTYT
jgi:glucose/arabinose dehydrogenase